MPFGGKYRIIDFVLSNLINSGIYSIYVLTQFKSQSLLQHLRDGWQFGGLLKDQFIIPVPAQMRSAGETWYRGTADAIYQNINLIEQSDPHLVAIFGADHIYRMNIASMIEFHEQKRAEVTVAAIPVERRYAPRVRRDRDRARRPHHRLPREAGGRARPCRATRTGSTPRWATTSSRPGPCCASCTPTRPARAAATISGATFCRALVNRLDMFAYDFQTNRIPGEPAERLRLLARRGDHRRLLRSQHGPARGEPRAESLQPRVAAAHRQLRRPARQVHLRRGGPPRPGHRLDRLGRLHPLRGHGAQFGARPRRAGALRRDGGGLRDPRQLRHRPPGPRSAARSSTRTCAIPRTRRSATTSRRTSGATT